MEQRGYPDRMETERIERLAARLAARGRVSASLMDRLPTQAEAPPIS